MSKHIQKYPGLYAGCKAAGVGYAVIYARVRKGMSVEAALAMPVAKCGRPRGVKHGPRAKALLPWEQPGYVRAYHKKRVLTPSVDLTPPIALTNPPVRKKAYVPRRAEDTSPRYIRRIREAFCAEFIKTGELNQVLMRQLEEYAHAMRAPKVDPARVSDEPTAQDRGQEGSRFRNNRAGDAHSVDRQTARRIADFLRT